MDFNSLIGLEEFEAKQILSENGYNDIKTINNSRHDELCDSLLVCGVKENGNQVILVCGEFYLNIKE